VFIPPPPSANIPAPPFEAANQWSNMRSTTHQWDVYCRDQEGVVWMAIRSMKGEQPYHGAVGKRRKTKAEKAALAQQQQQEQQQQQPQQPQQAESPPEEKSAVTNGAPSGASSSNGTNGAAPTHA
jgi:hypothetical protein